MGAKDTVMPYNYQVMCGLKNKSLEDNLELQAEISFKAGIDEEAKRCIERCALTYQAGIREEQKRMTKALRELHKQGWTLSDVIEAEDTCGEDCQTGGVKE